MRILISFHNKVIFVFATIETEIFIASKQTFWMIRHIRKFFPQVSCEYGYGYDQRKKRI